MESMQGETGIRFKTVLLKRIFIGILAMMLFFLFGSVLMAGSAYAETDDGVSMSRATGSGLEPQSAAEHANLVVVVRFSDDATGDGATGYNAAYKYNTSYTNWQQFKSWFATTNIPYFDNGTTSMESYMTTISNGAYHVTSYFPQSSAAYTDVNPDNQNEDKTVTGNMLTYITLPHDKAYYETAGDLQLVEDAADIFNSNPAWTAGSASWGSSGTLDNLELVVQVAAEPETTDTLLWPHKSNASGAVSFGGMKVNEYNLVNSKAVGDIGTVKHEYLHSVGLGDLYRVGDTSNSAGPVGIWDIMGSSAGQWPLAISLVDLGFEDQNVIKTVSGAGTHSITLHTHYSSADDGQAVKVYSPFSSDEYFVFEYRKKDSGLLAPDHLVPSSGLIVYRVNGAVEADVNGHRTNRNNDKGYYEDAVYVFRPGETGIHDSAGNLMNAALSTSTYAYLKDTANTRTGFGSADLSLAAFTDEKSNDTIFDSTGRNSGITVAVTAQTDDSITFTLDIPDYSALDLWDTMGSSAPAGQADCVSTAVDSSDTVAAGTIYQSYIDTNADGPAQSIKVRSWNGSTWTDLGSVASGTLGHARLQYVGATLYCTYASFPGSTNTYRVAKWAGGKNWTQVASISTGTGYANVPVSAVIGDTLYVLVDTDNSSLRLYKLSGTSLVAEGSALGAGYATECKIASTGGNLAVICGDVGADFGETTGENIYTLNGGTWSKVYSESAGTARNLACASVGSSLLTFVAYDSGTTPRVRLIGSGGTVTSYDFTAAGTDIQDASLTVSGGYTYLTVVDGNGLITTWYAKTSAPASWTKLGDSTMSNAAASAESLSTSIAGGKVYVGAISSGLTSVTLLSHDLAKVVQAPTTTTLQSGWSTTYTGSALSFAGEATVSGVNGTEVAGAAVTYAYSPTQTGEYTATAPTTAGTWWVEASFAGDDTYAASMSDATAFTIKPATPTLTLSDRTMLYTGSVIELDAPVVEGVACGSAPDGVVTLTYYTDEACMVRTTVDGSGAAAEGGAPRTAGTYYAKAVIAASGNYAGAESGVAKLTITVPPAKITWSRLAGASRYDTAALIAKEAFGDGSLAGGALILARGDDFPDALSAASLAGALQCPILTTSHTELSAGVLAEMGRLKVAKVYLLGGTGSISQSAEDEITDAGIAVERIAGTSRVDTAILIVSKADEVRADAGKVASDTCVITKGWAYADALAMAPYAYTSGSPIFLANKDGSISDEVVSAIRDGGYRHVIVLGGTDGISDDSVQALKAQTSVVDSIRLAGASRYDTAEMIATWACGGTTTTQYAIQPTEDAKLSYDRMAVARGDDFPDALASVDMLGPAHATMLLVAHDATDQATHDRIERVIGDNALRISSGYILGGTDSVDATVEEWVKEATK